MIIKTGAKRVRFLVLLWCGLILALGLPGCSRPEEEFEEDLVVVQAYRLQPDSITSYLYLTGGLEAGQEAVIFSRVMERLESVEIRIGQRVERNQRLGHQSNRLWEQGLRQAEAALAGAEIQFNLVEQEFQRMARLWKQNIISQQQYDQIATQVKQAQAGLDQARAAHQQAREQLENTIFRAPFAGTIAMIMFEAGDMVAAGQPVFKIVDDREMRARLSLPDIYLVQVKIGQRVRAEFPSLPGQEFTGIIERIDTAIDPRSRTVSVQAQIDNRDKVLRSGLFGRFKIEIDRRENAIVVSDNAILSRTEVTADPQTGLTGYVRRYYVYVVKDSTARMVPVQKGLEGDGRVEIVSGLALGEYLIVVGQKLVKDGQSIRVSRPD